jgi:ribosomal protein L22
LATTEKRAVRAQAKWVRTSARKARLVAEHIRGRSVPEARAVLAFTPRSAAREMEKVLRSAVANAEANHGLLGDELVVSAAYVDEGPTLKRWRARARGRVARIRKRTCHITVLLEPAPESLRTAEKKSRRPSVRRSKPAQTKPAQTKPAETTSTATPVKIEAPATEEPAAEELAAETPEATTEETPKPKRRTPVRRKKTEEKES